MGSKFRGPVKTIKYGGGGEGEGIIKLRLGSVV